MPACTPETALRLAEHGNILGIDEGSGDLEVTMAILKDAPDGFLVFSGEDSLTLPMMVLGAAGTLSIVSNQLPATVSQIVNDARAGHLAEARRSHFRIFDLMAANYIDTNPIPVKAALAMMGLIDENYRPPLLPIAADKRALLQREMRKLNII